MKMKRHEIELIIVVFALFHFESFVKAFFKDAHATNIETFIYFNAVILSTTVVKMNALTFFFIIVDLTSNSTLRSLNITSVNMKCASRPHSIITIASTVILIISTSMIHKFATIENFSLNFDTVVCNSTNSFEIKFVELISIKQMSLKNYRVNKIIQIFVIYCKSSIHALSNIYNSEFRNIQRISKNNIMNCIINCAIYNNQRFVENNN